MILERLRQEARTHCTTQRELAKKLGCSDAQISRFLSGKTSLSVAKLDRLATVLGCRLVTREGAV